MKHILSVMTSLYILGKSPMKWKQHPDMTIAVDWDIKHPFKQTNTLRTDVTCQVSLK